MSWPASLTIGALTAIVAGVLAGIVANLCAEWYRISSFEGASGYFVVGMALVGAIVGALLGVTLSRILSDATFLKALVASLAVVSVVIGAVGGVARLQADVPPTLDGHRLVLAIELRWPPGRRPAEVHDSVDWLVRLSALRGNVARVSEEGPLWREDARLEGEQWIVPGAVDIFTGRGARVISFEPESLVGTGFAVPLPGSPGRAHRAWSAWLPAPTSGGDQVQFRFRVIPDNEPVRVEQVGPFEVATIGGGFTRLGAGGSRPRWISSAHFQVRHRGELLRVATGDGDVRTDEVTAVAVLGGASAALVVQVGAPGGGGQSLLVRSDGDRVQVEPIASGGREVRAARIPDGTTADADAAAPMREPAVGRIDRDLLAVPGAYLFPEAILDTRTLTVRPVPADGLGDVIQRIPPLGMAPDGLALVRLAWDAEATGTTLLVIDLAGGAPVLLPIDRATMRYGEIEQIDAAWLAHYFTWTRDETGRDRLAARTGVVPLPHRGTLTDDGTGYREYRVAPAGPGLRAAFEQFLVDEFQAVPASVDPAAYSHELRIGDAVVHVSYRAEDSHVGVWMDRGTDTGLVVTIAERFDRELQGGRYDAAFVP